MLLEEERYVTDDDAIAALPCVVQEALAEILHLGVHDLVQLLELLGIAEYRAPQGGTVQLPVRSDDRGAPPLDDFVVGWGAELDGPPREDVGVDDRRAALREQLRHGRFAAAYVPSETDHKHLFSPLRHTVTHSRSRAKVGFMRAAVNAAHRRNGWRVEGDSSGTSRTDGDHP